MMVEPGGIVPTDAKRFWPPSPIVPASVALILVLTAPPLANSQAQDPVDSGAPRAGTARVQISGRVTSIVDGDKLMLLDSNQHRIQIRLAAIDAPEYRQHYAQQAKQALAKLVLQQQVEVRIQNVSNQGPTVGWVFVNGMDVSAALVRQGAVWVDRNHLTDPSLLQAETEARAAKIGIWSLPVVQRVAPWVWRDSQLTGAQLQIPDPS